MPVVAGVTREPNPAVSAAERGEKLARTAISLWKRPRGAPETTADEQRGVIGTATAERHSAEAVQPLADEDEEAFSAVLMAADGAGVGAELRRIITTTRELGLHPRPFRYSIMVSPGADRRAFLITVWPQGQDGGSFRVWASPNAFVRFFPAVRLTDAQAEFGTEEGPSLLHADDVDRLLASIRRLVESRPLATPLPEPPEEPADGALPPDVVWLIETRASQAIAPIATKFAIEALRMDGVKLRLQGGRGEPSYFQVRHPRFSQVVAYAHPRPGELHIDYRLPADYETYCVATPRDNFYGIAFKAKAIDDLDIALRLLRDAMARPE